MFRAAVILLSSGRQCNKVHGLQSSDMGAKTITMSPFDTNQPFVCWFFQTAMSDESKKNNVVFCSALLQVNRTSKPFQLVFALSIVQVFHTFSALLCSSTRLQFNSYIPHLSTGTCVYMEMHFNCVWFSSLLGQVG